MDLWKYAAVAAAAASPIGELLVAIPLGIGLGLPPLAVLLVTLAANFAPVPIVSLIFNLAGRWPFLAARLNRRPERVRRVLERYGLAGIILVTPWIGVYATTAALEFFGMSRRKIWAAIAASLVAYSVVVTVLVKIGFTKIGWH